MANKNGIAGSSDDHAQHGEPDIGQALRGLATVTDAQHVAHRFEHGEGVELGPGVVLQGDKKNQLKTVDVRVSGDKSNPTATSLGSQRLWKFTQMRTLGTEKGRGQKSKRGLGDPQRPNQEGRDRLEVFPRRDDKQVAGGSPGQANLAFMRRSSVGAQAES